MHGADRDIAWLQRDFGIYICNLFDTHQVCLNALAIQYWKIEIISFLLIEAQNCTISYLVGNSYYARVFLLLVDTGSACGISVCMCYLFRVILELFFCVFLTLVLCFLTFLLCMAVILQFSFGWGVCFPVWFCCIAGLGCEKKRQCLCCACLSYLFPLILELFFGVFVIFIFCFFYWVTFVL